MRLVRPSLACIRPYARFASATPVVTSGPDASLPPVHSEHWQYRRKVLARLREWDTSFTVATLEGTIADVVRVGDLSLGWTLYHSVGLSRGVSFDSGTQLGSYLFAELLPHSLEAAVSWVVQLAAVGRTLPTFCLEALLERICAEGAAEQMHRLRGVIDWTLERLEQVIVRVFLRAGDRGSVLDLLALAQQRHWTVSQSVWLEIMEVTVQAPPGKASPHLGRLIQQTTDRHFDRLQAFLDELRHRKIRLSTTAIDALEHVITATLVPASFLEYLDQYGRVGVKSSAG